MTQPDGAEKFFGRRKGRTLRARQKRLMDELLPTMTVDLSGETVDAGSLFDGKAREVWLEVGFGAGEHLVWQAQNNPDVGIIGCEPYINGVARLLGKVEDEGITNARIIADDARLLMDKLPDQSLDRVFVLFPDPWPKTRHAFRRFIGPANLERLARLLRDGAILRVASDHKPYVRWTMLHAADHPDFEWLDEGPCDWHVRPDDWPATRYEQKALAGRPHYLQFRRKTRV
ncbi:tRNA (guanosine(46)-N7)-methyltransferase TrmB [Aestuariispira insulae]|uniref:tRNA (guanine-N(7)-)-methyltransferase n=1 Tax=Aestuariispira insulae TaxID=1461337 RepID=A0A3D9HPR2_9PROT|nr:tRNA (guanosine(46)-N7)-methyltransferase TrmB [Aestuariispira insulae]RED51504.1 tRNA (guanine-N(7)-)-methyltransferase [Aestuariispira insulae]